MTDPVTILDSDAALKAGLAALSRRDPVIARLLHQGAVPVLRKRAPGFEGLAWIVVGQQVSTASATAIWTRMREQFGALTPSDVLNSTDEALRRPGLSAPKIRTLRAAAAAVAAGSLPLDTLHERRAEEAHALLTAVKGIGPWTAEVYLLFCIGHADAFPAGDLALQEAARIAYGHALRPNAAELTALAERWRPLRGVAAKVLWAFYRVAKAREGAPVPPGPTGRLDPSP